MSAFDPKRTSIVCLLPIMVLKESSALIAEAELRLVEGEKRIRKAGLRVLHIKAEAFRRRTQSIGSEGNSYGTFLGVLRRNIGAIMHPPMFRLTI